MEQVDIIGIDLAKRSFQLHGARSDGSVAFRESIRNFVLWAIVMKKKGASYGNREGTIGPAVGWA